MHGRTWPVRSFALALLGGGLWACSFTVGNDRPTQCSSEADCRNRGGEFAELTCNAEHLCVPIETDKQRCSTNKECIERNAGKPFRCLASEGRCAPLLSNECTRILGDQADLLNDEAIYFGVMSPPNVDGQLIESGVESARVDIKNALGGGLPPVAAGREKRPMVFIACPAELPFDAALRAGRHLGRVARVHGIVGPLITTNTLALTPEVFVPESVLVFGLGVASALTTLDDNDLVFRANISEARSLALLNPLFSENLEARLVADGIAAPGEKIRVQLVHNLDATGRFARDAILRDFKFNGGVPALDNGTNFRAIDFGNFGDFVSNPVPTAKINAAIADVYAFKPHVVIIAAGPDVLNPLLLPMEAQWPVGTPKPIYISTVAQWANFVVAGIGKNDSLRRRYLGLEGLSIGFDPNDKKVFDVDIRGKFKELEGQNIGTVAVGAYESVYLLAYGVVGAGASQLRGDVLAKGVRRATSTGDIVPMSVDSLSAALAKMTQGASFVSRGPGGEIRFDDKGDRQGNAGLFCVGATAGTADKIVRPGYTLDSTTGRTSGSAACP